MAFSQVTAEGLRESSQEFKHISITTLGNENYLQANLMTELGINAQKLELEKMEQPKKFVWWGRAMVLAKHKVSEAKDARARIYAELSDYARANIKTADGKRLSDVGVDNYIIQQTRYIEANRAYRDATKVYNDIEIVVESLRQRYTILDKLKFDDVKHLKS